MTPYAEVIGDPIAHSKSPLIHGFWLEKLGLTGDYRATRVVGGIIESAVNGCTHGLADRLNALGIPATFDFKPTGTHSWGYWQDDLHNSWPMIAGSMGAQ